MQDLQIETDRLLITAFDEEMAKSVHINSLDRDNRTFVPDEVFETVLAARDAISFLLACYADPAGPFVYPIVLRNGENIGHVQAVPLGEEWEIGYHIAEKYTGKGYATEAVKAFSPEIMQRLGIGRIWGICRGDNIASRKVLEKCAFILQDERTGTYKGENSLICRYLFTNY